MGRLSGFKYKQVAAKLKKLGFICIRQSRGSHEIWHNKEQNKYTTVPNHKEVKEGTLRSVLKQGGIRPNDFLKI